MLLLGDPVDALDLPQPDPEPEPAPSISDHDLIGLSIAARLAQLAAKEQRSGYGAEAIALIELSYAAFDYMTPHPTSSAEKRPYLKNPRAELAFYE